MGPGIQRCSPGVGDKLGRATLWAIASLLAISGASPAVAAAVVSPLLINVEQTIIWQTPSVFPGATFTGSSSFMSGIFNSDGFLQHGSFGAQTYTVLFPPNPFLPPAPIDIFYPPTPWLSGDAIIWQFGGLMAVGGNNFVTDAFPPAPWFPPSPWLPPSAPPNITIGLNLTTGFAPIDLTGGIFTFDDPVQIGTWEIRVTQSVPEPSTWAMMLLGFAGIGFTAYRRKSKPAFYYPSSTCG